MKQLFVILSAIALLASAPAARAQNRINLTTTTNGVLRAPTNFFAANSNLLSQAIASSGGSTNNPVFTGRTIIRTNLLVDGTGSGTIGGTNVFEVMNQDTNQALTVGTNLGVTVKSGLAVGTSAPGVAGSITASQQIVGNILKDSGNGWRTTGDGMQIWSGGRFQFAKPGVELGGDGDAFLTRLANNTGWSLSTNFFSSGTLTATNGLASYATTSAVSIDATGWTNTFTVNAVVYMDAAASLAYYVKNNAGTSVYTNVVAAATVNGTAILQPGGAVVITGGTTPTGRAAPF